MRWPPSPTPLIQTGGGCANIAVVVRDDYSPRWVVGSVSDDPYDIRTCVLVEREPDRLAYVATELRPASQTGMADRGYVVTEGERGRGVNEAGLALTWAFVREREPVVAGGMSSGEFARHVLSRCRSVAEALSYAETARRDFSGAYFLVDEHELAQVEVGRSRVVATRRPATAGSFAVNVNCYQAMTGSDHPSGALTNASAPNGARLRAAGSRLAALDERAQLEDVARTLADHEGIELAPANEEWVFASQGFSICNHGTFGAGAAVDNGVGFGSVSGEILDPATRTLWYCFGWPCGGQPQFSDQPYQERSWGYFLPFCVDELPAGDMTTIFGDLLAAAQEHIDIRRAIRPGIAVAST